MSKGRRLRKKMGQITPELAETPPLRLSIEQELGETEAIPGTIDHVRMSLQQVPNSKHILQDPRDSFSRPPMLPPLRPVSEPPLPPRSLANVKPLNVRSSAMSSPSVPSTTRVSNSILSDRLPPLRLPSNEEHHLILSSEEEDDEFNRKLEADLEQSLGLSTGLHSSTAAPTLQEENQRLGAELKMTQERLKSLQNSMNELQDSHDGLRQQLLDARKTELVHQASLVDGVSEGSPLSDAVLALRRQIESLSEEHERKMTRLKIKYTKLRNESAVRVFELQEEIRGLKALKNPLSSPSRTLAPLPDLLLPRAPLSPPSPVADTSNDIQLLKKQLASKNQLIMDLSMQLADSSQSSLLVTEETIAAAAD